MICEIEVREVREVRERLAREAAARLDYHAYRHDLEFVRILDMILQENHEGVDVGDRIPYDFAATRAAGHPTVTFRVTAAVTAELVGALEDAIEKLRRVWGWADRPELEKRLRRQTAALASVYGTCEAGE